MALVASIVIALTVVPSPWQIPVVVAGLAWETAEAFWWIRWSQRRRARVGVEAILGERAVVTEACRPEGQVKIKGELWRARCEAFADVGDEVIVRGLDGLTLIVDRA
jgi:membrane-bound serine protease (ClpP class)